MNKSLSILQKNAIGLLKELINTPSLSKQEDQTAGIISRFMAEQGLQTSRIANNVFAYNKYFDAVKPTILLNSHHDTVKPNSGYTLDPYTAMEKDGKLFGLGSNDAGGALVSLIATFIHFYDLPGLKFNLAIAASAEEEISGSDGIELLLKNEHFLSPLKQKQFSCAIVGEPTQMQMAVAERGLLVLDCTAKGKAGHAARNEGENALIKAIEDINWFRNFRFAQNSDLLGEVKMSVTVIETDNKAHNVVPDVCRFVVDVRVNELYSFEEILTTIQQHVKCEVKPRSTRMRSSSIATDHPLVQSGIALGRTYYGSPTTSDKALMPFPSLKMGPGDSARSHTADEYIYVKEVEEGIELYIKLVEGVVL